jgi:hypothetical protein
MDSLDRVFRRTIAILALAIGGAVLPSVSFAQGPPDRPGRPDDGPPAAPKGKPDPAAVDAFVARLMAFDKNKDGKLTRDEITDERLLRTFDRADANKDGVVTKDELTALATRLLAEDDSNGGRRGFGFPGGPGGPGGPRGPGFGGPPRPGQILPNFLQDELHFTPEQRDQIAALQKEVDEKLDKLLTDAQKQQLKEMRPRFGPPGRRGRRGPGGGPDANGRRPDGPQSDNRRERGPGGPPPESDR